ncbi:MAG: hypothetical protein E7556_08065 [Ruminococcaceae bacterium]|nr:hypothetical protein [Oscillospiraceae bacterium]
MKRFLSLVLAFVFVMGICATAPMTITANAADSHSLEFKLNSDGKSYSVVDYEYDWENTSPLVVPGKYNGLPVTKIAKDALMGIMASEVVISEGITEIGEMAFFEGGRIQKITLPKTLKKIGDSAFGRCWSLQTINFPEGLSSIGNNSFFECVSLKSVVLPSTLKTIGVEAFLSCDELVSVKVKNKDVKIGSQAFGYGISHDHSYSYKVDSITFYAPKGSTTQTYAKNNGFKFVVKNTNTVTLATPTVKTSNTTKGIKITWNKIKNAESYRVYRRTYNKSTKKYSSWKIIKNTTGLSYTDKTVKLGTKYSYTVKAIKGNVASKYTATKGLKYNIAPTVKVANASSGIKVTWNTIANATGYTIYRKSYNTKTKKWESWKNITTAKASKTSWTDKSVKSGVYYKYTVRACNGKTFKSEYKSSDKILYLARPTVKLANNESGVEVSWNKVTGAKGYIVYRAEFNDETQKYSSWKNYGEVTGNVFEWTDTSVVQGATYKYTVRAKCGNFKSAYIGNLSITLPITEVTTVPTTETTNGEQNQ